MVLFGKKPGIASRNDAEIEMNGSGEAAVGRGWHGQFGFKGRHDAIVDRQIQGPRDTAVGAVGTDDDTGLERSVGCLERQLAGLSRQGQEARAVPKRGASGDCLPRKKVVQPVPHHQVHGWEVPCL